MPNKLTTEQNDIHIRAVACGRLHRGAEAELILVLQEVERTKLWRKFDRRSLFAYAVGELRLTDSVAGQSIAVARKASQVVELQSAVASRRLSASLASRIVRCLTVENAQDVIAFALTHTFREVDEECARRNPECDGRDRAKPTDDKRIKVTVTVSQATFDKLRRVESLEAQCGRVTGLERAIEAAAEEYLSRRDPVRKAERAQKRGAASAKPCAHRDKSNSVMAEPRRVPLTAAQRHAVHARDGGRCAHVGESGRRCGADRWVDVHHVHPVSKGGGNEPENLTTLCSYHHDLVHQASFPIDGQVGWIRARTVEYASDHF